MILNGTRLTDTGAKMLGRFDRIRKLQMDRTAVTDEMISWLPKELFTLTLNGNRITDQGIARLADGLAGVSLKELELDGTAVTLACAPHLARLPSLQSVSLRKNGFTEQDRAELSRQIHCKVMFDD